MNIQRRPNLVPDSYFLRFGSREFTNQDSWTCCRFSIHNGQETWIALGSNHGGVMMADAKFVQDPLRFEKNVYYDGAHGHNNSVMGIGYLPSHPNLFVVLHFGGLVCLYDVDYRFVSKYHLNNYAVKTMCPWPEKSCCFLTGSTDGSLIIWDFRIRGANFSLDANLPSQANELSPKRIHPMAHGSYSHAQRKKNSRRISMTENRVPNPVTSLLQVDSNHFISSSSLSSSGLRVWDMRYQKLSTPVACLLVPQQSSKESGVASMVWDRYKSNLYAASTDNNIYEYSISSPPSTIDPNPIRTLNAHSIRNTYVQCSASPISDHLLVGSCDGYASMWDLQESEVYGRRIPNYERPYPRQSTKKYLPSPKFKFGGHRGSTEYAQFNSNGEYIATLDEYSLKIWSTSFAKLDSDGNLQNEILVGSIPHRITYPELEPQIEIPRCSKSQASMRTPTQQSLQTFLSPSATDENKRPRPWKDTNTK